MLISLFTPAPWFFDGDFVVAETADGVAPDRYIAEITTRDSEGRIVPPDQQAANGELIARAPLLQNFVDEIARLSRTGESVDGVPFAMADDDAAAVVGNLIKQARMLSSATEGA